MINDDESLVGLTGGALTNDDDDEEPFKENDSNSGLGGRGFIAALTKKVTETYNFKTFTDTKEI